MPNSKFEIVWPTIALIAFVLLVRGCISVATRDQDFAPIRLSHVMVAPDPVILGQPATLTNGICLNVPGPVTVQVYLGLQEDNGLNVIGSRTIDLIGNLSSNGLPTRSLNIARADDTTAPANAERTDSSGCIAERIDVPSAPSTLPEGRWIARIVVYVRGDNAKSQFITEQSNPFTIRRAELVTPTTQ